MNNKNAIIIPVHNRKELTLACLKHLHKGDLNAMVVIVDDGSNDGTSAAIRAEYPNVEIVTGDGNLFWTGGISAGMSHAYDLGCESFIWLNDDTLIEADSLNYLIDRVSGQSDLVVAPFCYEVEDGVEETITNGCIGRNPVKGIRGKDLMVEGLSGYCVVFPRSVVEKIGFPDADKFPHYCGDSSYTHYAHQNGFKLCICGEVELKVEDRYNPRNLKNYIGTGAKKRNFADVFVSKKSPYRMDTKRNMLVLRYGGVLGRILFSIVFVKWRLTYLLSS